MTTSFRYSRSILIQAPADDIRPEIIDLRRHAAWSPFSKPDPKSKETIEGGPGVGQSLAFEGGRSGAGRLHIDAVEPGRLLMTLNMIKPVKARNTVEYTLVPEGDGTRVSWSLSGPLTLMGRIMGLFINCEAMCGGMFEQGLKALKAEVESRGPTLRAA